jgi:hypothetical protein
MDKISVTLDMSVENPLKEGMYVAFTHKKTKSGHSILIYEKSHSPLIAKNRLLRLLGDK